MKNYRYLILLTAVVVFTFQGVAQISLKGIKNKAGDALENALERKIEQEMDKAAQRVVDKYWERVLGKYYSGLYEQGSSAGGAKQFPFVLNQNVEIEDEYSFDHAVKMKVESYKKNGKLDNTSFMVTHTNENERYMGTEILEDEKKSSGEKMFVINDFKNDAMVMLMEKDGEKMKLTYGIALDEAVVKQMEENEEEQSEIPTYEVIGTKDILGYPCKGYRTENDEAISEIWMAHEDVFGMENMFGASGLAGKNPENVIAEGYPDGSIMEVNTTDKKSKEKVVMQIVEIDDNINLTLNMSDYQTAGATQEVEKDE